MSPSAEASSSESDKQGIAFAEQMGKHQQIGDAAGVGELSVPVETDEFLSGDMETPLRAFLKPGNNLVPREPERSFCGDLHKPSLP